MAESRTGMCHSWEDVEEGEGESTCMCACSYKCRRVAFMETRGQTTSGAKIQRSASFFFFFFFLKQDLLLAWNSLGSLIGWASLSPSVRIFTSIHYTLTFLTWVWRIELMLSLWEKSKASTLPAVVSPVPLSEFPLLLLPWNTLREATWGFKEFVWAHTSNVISSLCRSQGHGDLKQPVTPTVKSRENRHMHAEFCLAYLLHSYTVKDLLPREWHRPYGVGVGLPFQWKESRQCPLSLSMGHPDLNILQLLLRLHFYYLNTHKEVIMNPMTSTALWENPNVLNIFRKLILRCFGLQPI